MYQFGYIHIFFFNMKNNALQHLAILINFPFFVRIISFTNL